MILKLIDKKGFQIDTYNVNTIEKAQKIVNNIDLIGIKIYLHIKSKL